MAKYPPILPKPASSSSISQEIIMFPQASADSRALGRPIKQKSNDSTENREVNTSVKKQKVSEPDEEDASLLSLIYQYLFNLDGDLNLFMSTSGRGYKSYTRHFAVHASIQAHDIRKNASPETLEKFFEKVKGYNCFNMDEILAAKNTFTVNSQDQPPLSKLLHRYQNESLRYVPFEFPVYSTSYRRSQTVLLVIGKYNIYDNLDCDTIEKFFTFLSSFCHFHIAEISAVKRHMLSVMDSDEHNSSEKVIQSLNALKPFFWRESQAEECLMTEFKIVQPSKTSEVRKSKEARLEAKPNEVRNLETEQVKAKTTPTYINLVTEPVKAKTKPVETSCQYSPSFCPICRIDLGLKDVWQHILRIHVEWERAFEHGFTFVNSKFCTHCFQTGFSTLKEVIKHETSVHGINKENSCAFCGVTCHDIFGFYNHVIEEHTVLQQCPICGEEFCLKEDFMLHVNKLHKIKYYGDWRTRELSHILRYFCPYCNARFSSHQETVNHLFNRYNASKAYSDISKSLVCFSCGSTFQTHEVLMDHLQSSETCNCKEVKVKTDRSFSCYSCKEKFETQEALNFHQSPSALFAGIAPVSTTGPRNFKKKSFAVTCDLKRLRRSDLAPYPHALDSMLNSFETLHKSAQDLAQTSEVRTPYKEDSLEVNDSKVKSKHGTEKPAVETNKLISITGENTHQYKTVSCKHKRKRSTQQSVNDMVSDQDDIEPISIGNSVQQTNLQPVTINDGQGNTVIINNQSGGSNTIILGGCCSHDSNQQENQPSSIRPSLLVDGHNPRNASLTTENVPEIVIKDEEEDELALTKAKKAKIFKEQVVDIQAMVREQFKSVECGRKEEIYEIDSALHVKVKGQGTKKSEDEIREIVRQEFNKYLESMYRGSTAPNENSKDSEMIHDTMSAHEASLETQIPLIVRNKNKVSIEDTDQTVVHVPHKESQPVRMQPNLRPENWRADEPLADSTVNYQQDGIKSESPPLRSGAFMSDRDSMQALYGIKSPEERCLATSKPCKQELEIRLDDGKDKSKDKSVLVGGNSDLDSYSQRNLIHEKNDGIIEKNNGLLTDIKTEPMSPSPLQEDNNQGMTEMKRSNDFVQGSSEPCLKSKGGATATVDDSQNQNKVDAATNMPDYQSSNIQKHNKHINALKTVISSINEKLDLDSYNIRRKIAEKKQKYCLIAPKNTESSEAISTVTTPITVTSQSVLPNQSQAMSAENSKTVAVLLATKNKGYIAGVLEPSVGVTKALKNPNQFQSATKGKRGRPPKQLDFTSQFVNREKDNKNPSVARNAVQPLTTTSLSQCLGMMPALPVLQGPNIPTPISSCAISNSNMPQILVNQTLPGLSSQSIPVLPAPVSQVFSSMPLVTGSNTVPSQNMPIMLGTQTVSSLIIPTMSVSQAFSNQKAPTVNLSFTSNASESKTEYNLEKPDSAIKNIIKEEEDESANTEKKTSEKMIDSVTIIIKKEKDDQGDDMTSDSQISEQSIKLTESCKTASEAQTNSTLVNMSASQSVPTNQILMGQNLAIQGSNQALPIQTVQVQQGNQIIPGQAVQMLSPNQTFPCQTIPLWQGQVLPQQAVLNIPGSKPQSIQGITVSTPAKSMNISGQTTTTSTTSRKVDVQSSPLQLVSAGPKGNIFQGKGINKQNSYTAVQSRQVFPSGKVSVAPSGKEPVTPSVKEPVAPAGKLSVAPPGKVPIAPTGKVPIPRRKKFTFRDESIKSTLLGKCMTTIKAMLKGYREVSERDITKAFGAKNLIGEKFITILRKVKVHLSREHLLEEIYEEFGENSILGQKVKETFESNSNTPSCEEVINAERDLASSSTTNDKGSECMATKGESLVKDNTSTGNKTHVDETQSLRQTHDISINQADSKGSDSKNKTNETRAGKLEDTKINAGSESAAAENVSPSDEDNDKKDTTSKTASSTPKQAAVQGQSVKIQPGPQSNWQNSGLQQNMVTILPSNVQYGNTLPQNTIVLNQGVPIAVQQSPVIQTGFQQNILGPIQNTGMILQSGQGSIQNTGMVLQSGQMIPHQMIYQPLQVQQGSMVLPQFIMAAPGSQPNPLMIVQQPQVMNVNTGNQQQLILSGTQQNSVEKPLSMSQPTGQQQNQITISGSQPNPVKTEEQQLSVTQQAGQQQSTVVLSGTQSNLVKTEEPQPPTMPQQPKMSSGTQHNSVKIEEQQPPVSRQAGTQQHIQSNPVTEMGQQSTSKQAGKQPTSKQAGTQPASKLRPIKAKIEYVYTAYDASQLNKLENAVWQAKQIPVPSVPIVPATSHPSKTPKPTASLENAVWQAKQIPVPSVPIVPATSHPSKTPKPTASLENGNLQARLLPNGCLVPASYPGVENIPETPFTIDNVKNLMINLDSWFSPMTVIDMLDHFKTFLELALLPSKTDIDNFFKRLPFNFEYNSLLLAKPAERRLKVHTLLKACICRAVDLDQFSSECQKAPISWLKVEDEEIKKCFQRHLLHRDYATVIEGDMALGLAKLLNWTVKRRTSSAIFQRIRALQIRYRKGIYSKVTEKIRIQGRGRRKRRSKQPIVIDDDDDESDSEYDIIDKKLNIEPSIRSARENLRREVKERAAVFIETSDSDDFDFDDEFEFDEQEQEKGDMSGGKVDELVNDGPESDDCDDEFVFETLGDEHEEDAVDDNLGDGNDLFHDRPDSDVSMNVDENLEVKDAGSILPNSNEGDDLVQDKPDSDIVIDVDEDLSNEGNGSIHAGPNSKGSERMPAEENNKKELKGQTSKVVGSSERMNLLNRSKKDLPAQKGEEDTVSSNEEWDSGDTSDYEMEENENKTDSYETEIRTKTVSETKSGKPVSKIDKTASKVDKPVSKIDKPVSKIDKPVTLENVLTNIISKHMGLDNRNDGPGNESSVPLSEKDQIAMEEEDSDTNDYDVDKLVIKIEDSDED